MFYQLLHPVIYFQIYISIDIARMTVMRMQKKKMMEDRIDPKQPLVAAMS